jgi:hypothetical protein
VAKGEDLNLAVSIVIGRRDQPQEAAKDGVEDGEEHLRNLRKPGRITLSWRF